MTPFRSSRLVAALVLLLVFSAGMAAGFYLHQTLPPRPFPGMLGLGGPPGGPPRRPPPEVREWMLRRLDRELDLTAEQRSQVDSLLGVREAEIHALMTETRPQFAAIAERTRNGIRAVLTPAQQEKFAALVRRMDEERRDRRGGP